MLLLYKHFVVILSKNINKGKYDDKDCNNWGSGQLWP